ncbi:hypothetical protein [Streptomyces sp. NPDC055134]
MTKKIVFIGAAGEMCRVVLDRFVKAGGDFELMLCDIRPENVEGLARSLPQGMASVQCLDLFEPVGLRKTIEGAAPTSQVVSPVSTGSTSESGSIHPANVE